MSCRFVVYHILIKTKWTCPPGSQDKRLNCLLWLICLANTADFLLARQEASRVSFHEHIPSFLLFRKLQVWNCRLWAEMGSLIMFYIFYSHYMAAQLNSAPWQDICIFVSRWLKISDMFVSWILPWQLERAVTSIAKYAAFFFSQVLLPLFFSFSLKAFVVSFPLQYRNSWN